VGTASIITTKTTNIPLNGTRLRESLAEIAWIGGTQKAAATGELSTAVVRPPSPAIQQSARNHTTAS